MTNTTIYIIINVVLDVALLAALAAAMRAPFRFLREPHSDQADAGGEKHRRSPARRRHLTATRRSPERV